MKFSSPQELHRFLISRVKPLKKSAMIVLGGLGGLGGEWMRNRYLDAQHEKEHNAAVRRFNAKWN